MAAWASNAWAANSWASNSWEGFGAGASTVAVTGTIIGVLEPVVVSTGGTVILTLTGDTFIAAGTGPIGTTAQSDALVAAITSAQAEAGGWNATVRDVLDNTDLVRTSNTVATLTVPATAGYAITTNEQITPVVQAAILTSSEIDLTSNSFSILATEADTTGLVITSAVQSAISTPIFNVV